MPRERGKSKSPKKSLDDSSFLQNLHFCYFMALVELQLYLNVPGEPKPSQVKLNFDLCQNSMKHKIKKLFPMQVESLEDRVKDVQIIQFNSNKKPSTYESTTSVDNKSTHKIMYDLTESSTANKTLSKITNESTLDKTRSIGEKNLISDGTSLKRKSPELKSIEVVETKSIKDEQDMKPKTELKRKRYNFADPKEIEASSSILLDSLLKRKKADIQVECVAF